MRIKLVVTALLAGTLLGCVSDCEYDVAVRNSTGMAVDHAKVLIGSYALHAGNMDPGIDATEAMVDVAIPAHAKARVEWRTADGVQHVKEVALDPVVPPSFRKGVIIFEITKAGEVTVVLGTSPVPKGTVIWETPTSKH